jgi:Saxitoxin biosynthesis operon protein SxtJ
MQKDLNKVTDKEARKTTLVVAAVLTAAAALFWYRGKMTSCIVSISIAALLVLIGFLFPPAAKAFHRIWYKLAFALGWVNSRILLTIIYFLIFVPYRIVSRAFGRDPLQVRQGPRESYWHKREKTRQTKEQFERLF